MRINKIKVALLFVSLLSIEIALAHTGNKNYGMMHNNMWSLGMVFFGWFFMGATAIILTLLVVWIIKQIKNSERKK